MKNETQEILMNDFLKENHNYFDEKNAFEEICKADK